MCRVYEAPFLIHVHGFPATIQRDGHRAKLGRLELLWVALRYGYVLVHHEMMRLQPPAHRVQSRAMNAVLFLFVCHYWRKLGSFLTISPRLRTLPSC